MGEHVSVSYTCDECQKPVIGLYGPLRVTIRGDTEPQVNADLLLCSFNCLAKYATDKKRGV